MKTEVSPLPSSLPISAIQRSPTNPREHFDAEKEKQLAQTLRPQPLGVGFLQNLLVRPWPGKDGVFELVDGERRWRAAKSIGIKEVPVTVRDLTDAEVVKVQLVAGDNSEPLTPIEEGKGFKRALELKGKDGKTVFTLRSLADDLGCSHTHIKDRVSLLGLPASTQSALVAGTFSARTAALIARIPAPEDRVLAATDIVTPLHREQPLTYKEAEALIHERYMVSLRAAPFDVNDATLPGPNTTWAPGGAIVPEACAKCPLRTGNDPERFGDVKDKNVCTSPGCYRKKCNVVWDRTAADAKAKGREVLTDAQAAAVFEEHLDTPTVRPDSPYVDLNTKPTYRHVANEVEDKKLPTWKQLLEGAEEKGIKVPVIEARHHRSGRRIELVKIEHAIEAAKKLGEDIFKKDNIGSVVRSTDDFAQKKKSEQEGAKRRLAENCLALVALHDALSLKILGHEEITEALLPAALHHAGADGQALFVKAFGLKSDGGDFGNSDAIEAWFKKTSKSYKHAAIAVLLLVHDMKWHGLKSEGFIALAEVVKLDVKAIEAKATAQLAAAKPGKKSAAPKPAVTTDSKTLAEWTKAYANNMPVEEIARSYNKPIEDVCGALGIPVPKPSKIDPGATAVGAVLGSIKIKTPKGGFRYVADKAAKKKTAAKKPVNK